MNNDNDDDKVKDSPDEDVRDLDEDHRESEEEAIAAEPAAEVREEPAGEPSRDSDGGVARGLFRLFVLLILVLLLGAVGYGGWYGWQWLASERDELARLEQAQSRQSESLEALEARVQRLAETQVTSESFQGLRDELVNEVRNLRRETDTVFEELNTLREAARGSRRDLALGEIEYLLRTGADALYLSKDVDTAIYALQAADDRLRQLAEPRLNPVRERISDHLRALSNVRMPDVQGVAMKLGSMMRQASDLPLRQAQHARAATEAAQQAEEESDWLPRLRSGFQRMFNKLVVVQRAEPPPALLSPEEHFFLYRNVELQFSAARAALLANDARSYRQSLEMAREWISAYFDTGHPAVQNTIADINGLLEVSLQPDLPDISPALERFRALAGNNSRLSGARTE